MKANSYIIYISAVLCMMLGSCKEKETPPFTTGSVFVYATAYTTPDRRITKYDTLSFTILKKDITAYTLNLKKVRWENTRHDYYQVRGLNTRDGIVELQLPLNYRGFDNELISVAGHPTVSLTGGPGYTLEEEDKYVKGYGSLSGLTIKQQTKDLRDTAVIFDGESLPCRLLQRGNLSHTQQFGKYNLFFTYNPTYGFITMNYYYPDGKHISLRLIDVTIVGK